MIFFKKEMFIITHGSHGFQIDFFANNYVHRLLEADIGAGNKHCSEHSSSIINEVDLAGACKAIKTLSIGLSNPMCVRYVRRLLWFLQ
jgi:hypothetical protein